MEFVFFLVCMTLALKVLVEAVCDDYSSPAESSWGGSECMLIENYTTYQWATCAYDSYIKSFSKERNYCKYSRPYCWYQCMLEVHEIQDGPVYDDCACDPNAVGHNPFQDHTGKMYLPLWCYSPNGSNCDWYTDCLEKRHTCSSDEDGYAVQFALTFCNLYERNQNSFSFEIQRWIVAVRKCLEVKLVPILRPYVNITCDGIKNLSFGTQTPCYLAPYPGEPSICDLDLSDWGKVFWTIKGVFADVMIPSLKGMLDATSGCASGILEDAFTTENTTAKSGMRMVKLFFRKIGYTVKGHLDKRSSSSNELANSVAKQLAQQMHWERKGVQWFSYSNEADDISVSILFGSRSMYDVNALGVPEADMNETVDNFAVAVGSEKLHLNFGKDLNLTHFSACFDFDCTSTYHDVTPKLKALTSDAFIAKACELIFFLGSILLNLVVKQLN